MPPPEAKFLCPECGGQIHATIRSDSYFYVNAETGAFEPAIPMEGPFDEVVDVHCMNDCEVNPPFQVKMGDDGWELVAVK